MSLPETTEQYRPTDTRRSVIRNGIIAGVATIATCIDALFALPVQGQAGTSFVTRYPYLAVRSFGVLGIIMVLTIFNLVRSIRAEQGKLHYWIIPLIFSSLVMLLVAVVFLVSPQEFFTS